MIRKILFASALLFIFSVAAAAAPETMRLDYYHTGNSAQEVFRRVALARGASERLPPIGGGAE